MNKGIIFVVAFSLSQMAFAKNTTGLGLAEILPYKSKRFLLNGAGIRSVAVPGSGEKKIYVLALYLLARTTDAVKVLNPSELKYFRQYLLINSTVKEQQASWMGRIKIFCAEAKDSCTEATQKLNEYLKVIEDIKANESTYYYLSHDEVEIFHESKSLYKIKSKAFSQFLLSMWVGDNPLSSKLRGELLGN